MIETERSPEEVEAEFQGRVDALKREGRRAIYVPGEGGYWGIEGSGLVGTHNKTERAAWEELVAWDKRFKSS